MKKKQLFAVLLAGSMTVGMAPAAAFAAEDTGAVTEAEASTAVENTETPDDGAAVDDQSQSEADAQAEAEAQAAAQAQAEAEAQAAAQAQAEAEAQAAAQAQAEAEAQAAAQAQAEEAQQEQQTTAADATVTTAAELQAAINNAPDFAGSIDDSDLYTSAYKILISASFNLTDTITVPANKNIAIFGATNATTVVGRGSVAGDMFKVSAGSILSMTQNEGDGSSEIGKLSVHRETGLKADPEVTIRLEKMTGLLSTKTNGPVLPGWALRTISILEVVRVLQKESRPIFQEKTTLRPIITVLPAGMAIL